MDDPTVFVFGEFPTSTKLTAAFALCAKKTETAAVQDFGGAFTAWFLSLPTTEPFVAGQAWNNGGLLAVSRDAAAAPDFGSVFTAWFLSLPTTEPSGTGRPWNNGGILAVSGGVA